MSLVDIDYAYSAGSGWDTRALSQARRPMINRAVGALVVLSMGSPDPRRSRPRGLDRVLNTLRSSTYRAGAGRLLPRGTSRPAGHHTESP